MYCNGRKVGYAFKRQPSKADMDALRVMSAVVVGAGMISGKELDGDDEVMSLGPTLREFVGHLILSTSFHLIDPHGSIGVDQELSIFFFRLR
jgi:uncharacterized protein (TIGR01570 family)